MRRLADDIIKKDAALAEYIRTVDHWGEKIFSGERCVTLLGESLGCPTGDIVKTIAKLRKSGDTNWADAFQKLGTVTSSVKTLLDIVTIISALAST